MGLEHIEFLKGAFIEQKVKPLPGRHLALGMVPVNTFLTAAKPCLGPQVHEFVKFFMHGHIFSPFAQNSAITPKEDLG